MNKQKRSNSWPSRKEIEQIVNKCIDELFEKDRELLEYDVSERAITHKIAEYLQRQIPDLNVDCEYNRNSEFGERASKMILLNKGEIQNKIGDGLEEDDMLAISTYPDIIVHRRLRNDKNLLIIEVKKKHSKIPHNHDHTKLKAFTDSSNHNRYHYKYGAFILINTGLNQLDKPQITWFINGRQESDNREDKNNGGHSIILD